MGEIVVMRATEGPRTSLVRQHAMKAEDGSRAATVAPPLFAPEQERKIETIVPTACIAFTWISSQAIAKQIVEG